MTISNDIAGLLSGFIPGESYSVQPRIGSYAAGLQFSGQELRKSDYLEALHEALQERTSYGIIYRGTLASWLSDYQLSRT